MLRQFDSNATLDLASSRHCSKTKKDSCENIVRKRKRRLPREKNSFYCYFDKLVLVHFV